LRQPPAPEREPQPLQPNAAAAGAFRTNLKVILASLFVGAALTAIKFYAAWITNSSAILSDALESIINVVAATFAAGSLLLSAKPPDESHPYGHGKIEYFSAGFEGALIILAAAGIFYEGLRQIIAPHPLPQLREGLLIVVGVGLVNLALGIVLIRVGRRNRSLVLVADGKHILTDVYTSAGVLGGLVVVHVTGWYPLDGIVACLMGINIVVTGYGLVRQSVGGLMDAAEPALLEEICDLLAANRKELWIDVHRLRAWRSGSRVHVDFHLILPRDLPLEEGHRQVKEIETIFADHFAGQADLLVHLDPCAIPECPACGHDPCSNREEEQIHRRIWKRDQLTCDAENREFSSTPRRAPGDS